MSERTPYRLASGTVELLETIEKTADESARLAAIQTLAATGGKDGARVLMETFERTMWRSTKVAIVQALGPLADERVVHFLIKLATHKSDLALAAEAVLALGLTNDAMAGEFLVNALQQPNHPLSREIIVALTNLVFFPCEAELLQIFSRPESEVSPALIQFTMIALSVRGYKPALKYIEPYLDLNVAQEAGNLFNSAIIAAGRLGGQETLAKLEALDTRYRFFAHQLKAAAIERIQLRLACAVEDAISALFASEHPMAMRQALNLLAEFPEEQAREAFHLLGGDSKPELSCLVRAQLFAPHNGASDSAFMKEHGSGIPTSLLAGVVRLYVRQGPKGYLQQVIAALAPAQAIAVLGKVYADEAISLLAAYQTDAIAVVNAMVAQCYMTGFNDTTVTACGNALMKLLERESPQPIKERILRALGQIRFQSPLVWQAFNQHLKDGEDLYPSFYAGLAASSHIDAVKTIVKRLKKIIHQKDHEDEIRCAVEALASFDESGDVDVLGSIGVDLQSSMSQSLLKILCHNQISAFSALVEASLRSADFQVKLLAVAAAKLNGNEEIWDELLGLLNDPNVSIAGRALDSLCVGGSPAVHLKLLQWLSKRPTDEMSALKICRSITPREGGDYKPVIVAVDQLLLQRKGVFSHPEFITAATNLRDNIEVSRLLAGGAPLRPQKGAVSAHAIDGKLAQKLSGFNDYSETVKSVLRNAELTFTHPELFDERVDKSTVVVQYVKSIDILLQEKIGAVLFLRQGSDILQQLQSRLLRLQLDEETLSAEQIIANLQCGFHFSAENFPANKLVTLARSIMTGKIIREQYRVLDGLRAWALLFLLYGRSFKCRNTPVEPLFKMKNASNAVICQIAQHLNNLQDIRNSAAHRGTLLEVPQLEDFRGHCFLVLNELHSVLN